MLWRRMAEHERHRRAERRDLRESQIDKDHFAGEDLDAEIGMDADKAHRHQERRPEELRVPRSSPAPPLMPAPRRWHRTARCNRRSPAVRRPTRRASRPSPRPCLLRMRRRVPARAARARRSGRRVARMVWTIPASCEGLGGTPGLISIKSTKFSRNRRAK